MKTFQCVCGNSLFFDNTQCLVCARVAGWCPACQGINALLPQSDGSYQCGNAACGHQVALCKNYSQHQVCNRCVPVAEAAEQPLCACCRLNDTIPDLTVEGNLRKWARLEAAKRRLFYDLDLIGLQYGGAHDGFNPPLSFDFKADVLPANTPWRAMGVGERVMTGHDRGKITINIREADSVEREKLRVDLGESHRTLIGHFRHEIGHYYWDVLVRGQCEPAFVEVFGDHQQPPYDEALESYYQQGPPSDWRLRHVSAYAAMHPWEDFAETFATYLDIVSVLDTGDSFGFARAAGALQLPFDEQLIRYQQLGIAINEINRSMGLIDLVPEIFAPAIVDKLRWTAGLLAQSRSGIPA